MVVFNLKSSMSSEENVTMVEWLNGRMGEWVNGGMDDFLNDLI